MRVVLYVATSCPYGGRTRGYLKSKGVSFEEVYVDLDPSGAQEVAFRSKVLGVPYIRVIKNDGAEIGIPGFDKVKLDKALGL